MRVLVIAPPKSGSTALYSAIEAVMPPGTKCYHEPPEVVPEDAGAFEHILVKKLTVSPENLNNYDEASLEFYDRVVFLVRDPRDIIVSNLLWCAHEWPLASNVDFYLRFQSSLSRYVAGQGPKTYFEFIENISEILNATQAPIYSGTSAPLFNTVFLDTLIENIDIWHRVRRHYSLHGYHTVRYEDFVIGHTAALCEYLGLAVQAVPVRGGAHARVMRTGSRHNWPAWMDPETQSYIRARLAHFLDEFDYPVEPPEASPDALDHRHTTGYVQKLLEVRPPLRELSLSKIDYKALQLPEIWQPGSYFVPGLELRNRHETPSDAAEISDVQVVDARGEAVSVVEHGDPCSLTFRVKFTGCCENVAFGMTLTNLETTEPLFLRSIDHEGPVGTVAEGQVFEVMFDFQCLFPPGAYALHCSVFRTTEAGSHRIIRRVINAAPLIIRRRLPRQKLTARVRLLSHSAAPQSE